jgi:hypothetical protein
LLRLDAAGIAGQIRDTLALLGATPAAQPGAHDASREARTA